MKKFTKGLLFASLLALGSGAAFVPGTMTAKADANYGYTNVGSSVVKVIDTGAQIYDAAGNGTGKYLPMGSSWRTSVENTLASGTYYGIGKDEYVKGSDVSYYFENTGLSGYGQEGTNYDGVEITAFGGAALYDVNGNPIGKTLPDGSDWRIDQENDIASGTYYRVASGEYVKGNDVRVYQNTYSRPISQTITTTAGAPKRLYNSNGQLIGDRGLAPNTSWYTDRICNIGGVSYYRVATDEYVSIVDVD